MASINENNELSNSLCGCGCVQVFNEDGYELCPECDSTDEWYEDDGQPSEYDEWQDYMGGDDNWEDCEVDSDVGCEW